MVDDQLRVHGLQGLRLVDASMMPRMISANLNASTLMIADKASDMIRGKAAPEAAVNGTGVQRGFRKSGYRFCAGYFRPEYAQG
jgi:choline dehydrogenase-like flavoprotein